MEQKMSFKAITGRLIDATTVKNNRKRAVSGKQCTLGWYKLLEYYLTIAWSDTLYERNIVSSYFSNYKYMK